MYHPMPYRTDLGSILDDTMVVREQNRDYIFDGYDMVEDFPGYYYFRSVVRLMRED